VQKIPAILCHIANSFCTSDYDRLFVIVGAYPSKTVWCFQSLPAQVTNNVVVSAEQWCRAIYQTRWQCSANTSVISIRA